MASRKNYRISDGNWKAFRGLARYYRRELVRIRDATLCSAEILRASAKRAVEKKRGRL